MKRILSLMLAFILLLPTSLWAKEMDKDLEARILSTKQRIEVPEALSEFEYDLRSRDKENRYYFTWRDKQKQERRISVVVDKETGTILNYSYNHDNEKGDEKDLAKISYEKALENANAFLKKVVPEYESKLRLNENRGYFDGYYYEFGFDYCPNGIKVKDVEISVAVSKQDGKVYQFSGMNKDRFTYSLHKPKLTLKEAEAIYKEKIGVQLKYMLFYDYKTKTMKSFPAYIAQNSSRKVIDAFTGEVYVPQEEMNGVPYAQDLTGYAENAKMDTGLTPEETQVIEVTKGLLTKEEAIKRVANSFSRVNGMKVTYDRLYKDEISQRYIWNISGTVALKESEVPLKKDLSEDSFEREGTIHLRVNAQTGEVLNYNIYLPYVDTVPERDEKVTHAKVEALAKELAKDKYEKTHYTEEAEQQVRPLETKGQPSQSFYFERLENTVPVSGDGIRMTYNKVYDEITSYNLMWNDFNFEPIKGELSKEEIISNIGLKLMYVSTGNEERKLSYTCEEEQGLFNPYTGEKIDYQGKPAIEKEQGFYTDLEKHPAKAIIKKLYESGYSLPGKTFKPEVSVTQVDFLRYLQKMTSSSIDETEVYRRAIQKGILEETEKNPKLILTHETLIKYLINDAGYKKIAQLKNIYNYPFKTETNEELKGYITLAFGLDLIAGDLEFNPKAEVSRAQVAQYIYNSLR
ncbi:hypothetical protein CS063_15420 [Sporanaerobium hydrogeniformans]|uniref:Uncharacterized protein n=1 Tax=Sporanaerobium hydrogeniformans TaxID=3072179 RepID=A0AC61D7G2_9FIRM|nr:YcdB/YcdC domain-containing protein [Sporanaerobium hydrogeniformans]PHV69511.1 hypothetical protein CS063_15420 [Sporanaerobium hydrogeniformans]